MENTQYTRAVLTISTMLVMVWSTAVYCEGFQEIFPPLSSGLLPKSQSTTDPTTDADTLEAQLEEQIARQVGGKTEPVASASCGPQIDPSTFFQNRALTRDRVESTSFREKLRAQAGSVLNILQLLRTTALGAAIMSQFAPRYGFDIKVKPFTTPNGGTANEQTAQAVFDIEAKTIHVDLSSELGRVAFVFLHEAVHSLDEQLASSYEKEKALRAEFERQLAAAVRPGVDSKASEFKARRTVLKNMLVSLHQYQDTRLFRAERFAYDASYKVWQELATIFPQYYSRTRRPVQHSDAFLIENMGLNPRTIAAFQSGNCTVFRQFPKLR